MSKLIASAQDKLRDYVLRFGTIQGAFLQKYVTQATVPFQPSVQSRVTNDFELNTSGVSSWVTGRHEHLPVSIFAKFWPILLTNEQFWCLSRPKFGS